MLIDWFTVCAQVFNFLILVWLMKRFLYKPILHAIDEREKKVAAELADADAKEAEAQRERDEFARKNEEFDRRRDALLSRAAEEAEIHRQRLLEEARRDAAAFSAKFQETFKNDSQALYRAIGRRVGREVFVIARKAMADLAGTSLDERMAGVFIRRLAELDGPAKEALAAALKKTAGPAVVRSAFDLPPEQRAAIGKAVHELVSANIQLRFETEPGLIGGIELSTNGQKAAWNIADYMALLEKEVAEVVNAHVWADPRLHPESQPDEAGPEPPPAPAQAGKPESTKA